MGMGGKAVGFYWTLPVPWAGFTALPEKIEDAAKVSRTIRYQMELIRSYAVQNKLTLIREEAFLEVEPDRGTPYVVGVLKKLESFCREHRATLLYVDFSQAQGWRSHAPMTDWSKRAGIETAAIWPEEVMIDGQSFDPNQHFHDWRERQYQWSDGKAERAEKALIRIAALRSQKMSYEKIAEDLNKQELRSATGKPWTGEMVRKLRSSTKN
jgi:hypothetical protein